MTTSTALTYAPSAEVWEAADWKKLWRSICGRSNDWQTLAVVPAGPGISEDLSLQFAVALAYAGSLHLGVQIDVANGTRIEPAQVPSFVEELEGYMRWRNRAVVAISPFKKNEASLPIAKATDAALLCVLLGAVSGPVARETVAQLGAEHFVGTATFRLPSAEPPGRISGVRKRRT